MKRRDLLIGSASALVPMIARSAVVCPPAPTHANDPSETTDCPTASTKTYTTNVPTRENPISEGGRWTNGGIFGKNNVQTAEGKAYGTMVWFNGSQFVDPCACLSG